MQIFTPTRSWLQISIYLFPNYSSTFNSVSLVFRCFIAGSSFPYEDTLPSSSPHTHTHFPSPSLLSLISTSQPPHRVFFSIENKLIREHTCQHTLQRAFPRLRRATNGCCLYFTSCLFCASPPSVSSLVPAFSSPKRIRIHKTHTFMHRCAQKHKLPLLMDWLTSFSVRLAFSYSSWGHTSRQPPQTLVSIMWYPCFCGTTPEEAIFLPECLRNHYSMLATLMSSPLRAVMARVLWRRL